MAKQIENYVEENLTGEARQTALEFIDYLRTNEYEFIKDNGYWKDKIYYLIKFRDECVCFVAIKDPDEPENLWTIWSDDSRAYEDDSVEEDIKSIAWQYIDYCVNCGSCGGGKHKIVFGKNFEKVCRCTFRVNNPKANDLSFLKKIVDLRKKNILNAMQERSNE